MDKARVKLSPQGKHLVVVLDAAIHLRIQFLDLLLRFLHLEPKCRLFVLQRRERALPHLEVFLKRLQGSFIKLIRNSHDTLGFGPIFIYDCLLDVDLFGLEVLGK